MDDLVGLGKSVEKILEVFARGTGILYEPTQIRRLAEAEVYKIGLIAAAEAKKHKVLIESKVEGKLIVEKAKESLSDRVKQRKAHKERLKQDNIENVITFATLSPPKSIADEPIDSGWLNTFIENAETVSSRVMQKIWAKVFVNEIEKPGGFSLKSLEFLKTITRHEADIFAKLCRYVTSQPYSEGSLILSRIQQKHIFSDILALYNDNMFPRSSELDLIEWMTLKDLGLVHAAELLLNPLPKGEVVDFQKFKLVTKKRKVTIHFYSLTPLGNELAQLVDASLDEDYFKRLQKKYNHLIAMERPTNN